MVLTITIYNAGYLDATNLIPDSLTRLTWRWVRLDVGGILTPKMPYYNKNPFCSCVSKTYQ